MSGVEWKVVTLCSEHAQPLDVESITWKTHSPVIKQDYMRTTFSTVATHRMKLAQFTFCTISINGDLIEVVYML